MTRQRRGMGFIGGPYFIATRLPSGWTTALIVAHRPSTVLLADRVALLAGGRIAAVGTHSELLAAHPAYRDLLAQESDLAEVLP